MFQFSRFASTAYVLSCWYPCGWVSPFRHLRIKAYLPAPRSFSQAITSFIACNRQGIHHMLLVTWPYNFDLSCEKPALQDTKTGKVFHLTRYAVMRFGIFDIAISRTTLVITEFKVEFALTQSNVVAGTVQLLAFQQQQFRLYEFLKNSLLSKAQYKSSLCKTAFVLKWANYCSTAWRYLF